MRVFLATAALLTLVVSVPYAEIRRVPIAQAQAGEAFPPAGAPASITLLAPGKEPRAPLRYAVPAGYKGRVEIVLNMGMTMDMDSMMMPEVKLPTMKMTINMGVSDVAPNGDMTFQSRLASMHVDTAGLDADMAAAVKGVNDMDLSSLQFAGTMTNRGQTSQKLTLTGAPNAQIKQMMDSASKTLDPLSMPFPEDAMGVGARWETRQRMTWGGVSGLVRTTAEVVSIQGSRLTLKVASEMTAPSQPIKNPSLPSDADATLTRFKGTSKGTVVVDLNSMGIEGESSANTSMVMSVRMQGIDQDVSTSTTTKIKFTTLK